MKNKLLGSFVLLLVQGFLLSSGLFARDVNTARRMALAFQNQKISTRYLAPASPLQLVLEGKQSEGTSAYYIFNGAQNFVVIAGDDALPAVIGYSDQGAFDPNEIPPSMQWWLDELEHPRALVSASSEDSSHYEMSQNLPSTVAPLLGHTMWNQGAPYNDSVPEVEGKSCPIGCLATAVGQILKYYEYPSVGTGLSKSYTTRTHGLTLSSNFNVPYDWANILDEYDDNSSTQSREAVAHFMLDLAVLCEMDFAPRVSGAYASTARAGLQRYMGYDESVRGVYRSTMTYEAWENLLKNELANNGPFFFSAQSSTGGHAFVCDGYDQDNFFHINWGWSGKSNGYFLLSGMNPKEQGIGGSSGGYFYYIEANIGLRPKDNLDSGDLDRNRMSIERMIVPENTFQTTAQQELKLQIVRNTTGTTYYGAIALQVYKESNASFVKSFDKMGV